MFKNSSLINEVYDQQLLRYAAIKMSHQLRITSNECPLHFVSSKYLDIINDYNSNYKQII